MDEIIKTAKELFSIDWDIPINEVDETWEYMPLANKYKLMAGHIIPIMKSAALSSLTDTEGVMTEEALAELYKERNWLCFEPDITRGLAIATRQNAITSARKDLECQEKVNQERERIIATVEKFLPTNTKCELPIEELDSISDSDCQICEQFYNCCSPLWDLLKLKQSLKDGAESRPQETISLPFVNYLEESE